MQSLSEQQRPTWQWANVGRFLKTHLVTLIAALAAALSFLISPAQQWHKAIDWQTLNLLFCLMVVVAGLRDCALFRTLATLLLRNCRSYRALAHLLIQLTFVLAMLITNDVALLALTPFAIYLLDKLNLRDRLPALIVLQTVAANLGSMATPVGNPQNLFLYTAFQIPTDAFFLAMLPITFIGALLLAGLTHLLRNSPLDTTLITQTFKPMPSRVWCYLILFILSLGTVFRLIPHSITFVAITVYALICGRKALKNVDYGLLITFICFFIFSGNLAQITWVRDLFATLLEHHTQATATLASQVFSNVPAAILLEPFTEQWKALLFGVDIGGFGTPIASLASLISLGIYMKEPDANVRHYLLLFTLINLLFLIFLTLCSYFL